MTKNKINSLLMTEKNMFKMMLQKYITKIFQIFEHICKAQGLLFILNGTCQIINVFIHYNLYG